MYRSEAGLAANMLPLNVAWEMEMLIMSVASVVRKWMSVYNLRSWDPCNEAPAIRDSLGCYWCQTVVIGDAAIRMEKS